MSYHVTITDRGARDLKGLPTTDAERVYKRMKALADEPRPQSSRQLRGHLAHLRRLRVGDYRVGYEIDEEAGLVVIRAIGPRGNFYERLQRSH